MSLNEFKFLTLGGVALMAVRINIGNKIANTPSFRKNVF